MGMNFQDQPSGEKAQQKQPASNFDDPRVDDLFLDSGSSGRKLLWIALVVVVLAIVGGGLYMLNKYGYLSFLHRKAATTLVTRAAAPQAQAPKVTPSASTAGPATKTTTDRFAIQVSAFKNKGMADKYAANLKQKGIDAYVSASEVPGGGTWFKVCVGSFDTKLRAIAEIADVKEKVGTDVWVVPVQ